MWIPSTDGGYPPRPGNGVRPLVDGVPALARIGAAVAAARGRVWVTVAFLATDFRMPDGFGSLWDLLDRAAARGVDVRLICWRPTAASYARAPVFAGTAEELAMLAARDLRVRIRWDIVPGPYCHHQKSWVVDDLAFVGGINLTAGANGVPGHAGKGQHHDVYVELAGPAVGDVAHNFAQRWNGASERALAGGAWRDDGDLACPSHPGPAPGDAVVQIQRMIPAGHYADVAGGEASILAQYLRAIDAARGSIYIENQAVPIPQISARLLAALERGVAVAMLVPAEPEGYMREARRQGTRADLFDALAALGRHPAFTLAGIAGLAADGTRSAVYVHSKIMLVDDAWATIGSCNLHASSMGGHSELNASFWDGETVRALRCALLAEHLGLDTAGCDDRAALALFGRVAGENPGRPPAAWQGLAFRLDPASYGAYSNIGSDGITRSEDLRS